LKTEDGLAFERQRKVAWIAGSCIPLFHCLFIAFCRKSIFGVPGFENDVLEQSQVEDHTALGFF
jgi:hypothetical protein